MSANGIGFTAAVLLRDDRYDAFSADTDYLLTIFQRAWTGDLLVHGNADGAGRAGVGAPIHVAANDGPQG